MAATYQWSGVPLQPALVLQRSQQLPQPIVVILPKGDVGARATSAASFPRPRPALEGEFRPLFARSMA